MWPWGTYLGDEAVLHGVRMKVSSWRRIDPNVNPVFVPVSNQFPGNFPPVKPANSFNQADFWAQGVTLGNPLNIRKAGELGRQALVSAADQFARDIFPAVVAIQRAGTTSLGGVAAALNKQGIRTARGKRWHASSVANLLRRANTLAETPS